MIGGYEVTRPNDEDAQRLAEFMCVCEIAEIGVGDTNEHDIREIWERRGFSREEDAWVLIDGQGEIVAYAFTWPRADEPMFDVAVHPAHLGEGLGSALLDVVEKRMRERYANAVEYLTVAAESNKAAHALLASRGYQVKIVDHRMRIDVEPPLASPTVPEGVIVRPLELDRDGVAAWGLLNDAFEGHAHAVRLTFEDWRKRFFDRPDYEPSLYLVAEREGQMMGVCLNHNFGDIGFVSVLGVAEPFRRLGIGGILVLSAFQALAAVGQTHIELNVDSQNTTGATRLYERCGMRVERVYHFLARPAG